MGPQRRQLVFENIKAATVAVASLHEGGEGPPYEVVGSGFCIDREGLIVSCRHVLEALMEKPAAQQIAEVPPEERKRRIWRLKPGKTITPFVIFFQPSPRQVFAFPSQVDKVVAKTDLDLALIRIHPHEAFPEGFPTVESEEYEALYEGDEIATCGFPLGNFLYEQLGTVTSSFTKGIISSIIPSAGVAKELLRGFQLNLTATHGNSGGPVFSLASGRVFGVLQRGVQVDAGEFVPGLTKAEPLYPLLDPGISAQLKSLPLGEPFDLDRIR